MDGQVLQLHVRPGQYAGPVWNEPLIVLGDIHGLHVRVDIDEQDLPDFSPGSQAVATLKGRPQVRFPRTFFDTETYVIPKQYLTGSNTERVDTRVLKRGTPNFDRSITEPNTAASEPVPSAIS